MPTQRWWLKAVETEPTVAPSSVWSTTYTPIAPRRAMRKVRPVGIALTGSSLNESSTTNPTNIYAWQGISEPLDARAWAGSVKVVWRFQESLAGTNAFGRVIGRIVSNDGTVVRGTLFDFTSALEVVNNTVEVHSGAVNSVTVQANDRLVVEFGAECRNTSGIGQGIAITGGGNFDTTTDMPDTPGYTPATSEAMPWVEFQLQDLAPSSPNNLVETADTYDTVTIDWDIPTNGDPVTSYEVRVDGGPETDIGNVLSHTFTGLGLNSSHTFSVRALNNGGSSAWSDIVAGPELYVVPNRPTNLEVVDATTTSLDVAWDDPTLGTPPFTYELRVDGGPEQDMGAAQTYGLTGLEDDTTYLVEVRALNNAGSSAWEELEATTEAIPWFVGAAGTEALYVGAAEIDRAYLGTTVVYGS